MSGQPNYPGEGGGGHTGNGGNTGDGHTGNTGGTSGSTGSSGSTSSGSTSSSSSSSVSAPSAPPVDPVVAQKETDFAALYKSLWGEAANAGYIKHFAESGMNIWEFEDHERNKPAFRLTGTYKDEADAYASQLYAAGVLDPAFDQLSHRPKGGWPNSDRNQGGKGGGKGNNQGGRNNGQNPPGAGHKPPKPPVKGPNA